MSPAAQAGQVRSVTDRVYADSQAARGQQLYKTRCVACHGDSLQGVVGPPLTGSGFLAVWSRRSMDELVEKIEKTMPTQEAGSVSRRQAIEVAGYVITGDKVRVGRTVLTSRALT